MSFTMKPDRKRFFFDRQVVMRAIGKAAVRNLSKAGAFIRRAARSSLRRRKRVSMPGQTPSIHSKHPVATLKNIWFAWDPIQRSVVIGPQALNASKRLTGSNQPTVPALMEFGGVSTVENTRTKKRSSARYTKRPFMGPALDREHPKLPEVWANSVKK